MFGILIAGPTDMFCDHEAVYKNASISASILRKKHHSVAFHRCIKGVASGTCQVAKEDTETNLSDIVTKVLPRLRREFILDSFTY